MKLDRQQQQRIHIGAHLHDIGKIGIPDTVLRNIINDITAAAVIFFT